MPASQSSRALPLLAALASAAVALAGCQPASGDSEAEQRTLQQPTQQPAPGQPMLLPIDPTPLMVETAAGERRFSIEVADDNGERSNGLMYRRTMPDDRGMLFIYETTRIASFWMKNTPMPLDLVFIGEDGMVKAVMPGIPFSEASISPQALVRFVLELKAGTAQKTGIAEGVRIRHPLIDAVAGG